MFNLVKTTVALSSVTALATPVLAANYQFDAEIETLKAKVTPDFEEKNFYGYNEE